MTHGINYGANARREFLPYVPPTARSFLDVGCAKGGWCAGVRETFGSDVRVVGLEADHDDAVTARAAGFGDVVEGFFPQALTQVEGTFDVVTFWDVLEHLADPWEALRALTPALAPGGVVLASIPNITYLPALREIVTRGRFPYSMEGGIFDFTHLRFFTRDSMVEMFEDCGYDVVTCDGFYDILEVGHYRVLKPIRRLVNTWRWQNFLIVATPRAETATG